MVPELVTDTSVFKVTKAPLSWMAGTVKYWILVGCMLAGRPV
jgi:hypothetical protein